MLKVFIIATIVSFAMSHQYFAENNFICTLCKESMKLIHNEKWVQLNILLQQFPKAQHLEQDAFTHLTSLMQGLDYEEMCQSLEMCGEELLDYEIDHQSIIETVNNDPNSSWEAGAQMESQKIMASQVKKVLGTVVDKDWKVSLPRKRVEVRDDLPTDFDSRTKWTNCPSIGTVRDQANCGSCWAFATTEAFNDRMCVDQGGQDESRSTSDTTGCCGFFSCFSMGCNGGQVGSPWSWFGTTGVVSGAGKGASDMCYDYTMQQCAHHVDSKTLPSCNDIAEVEPQCLSSCPDDSSKSYHSDKVKSHNKGVSFSGEQEVKQEIFDHGPLSGSFTVYSDFLTYTGGVYEHTTGDALGGHAIKIIGWGTDETSGKDYWLVVNSWNPTWGDNGLFKCTIDTLDDEFYGGNTGSSSYTQMEM